MARMLSVFLLALLTTLAHAQQAPMPDYEQWRAACAKLPSNRELNGKLPDKGVLPLPAFEDFERALDAFLEASRAGPLRAAESWISERPDPTTFFDTQRSWYAGSEIPFQPFAAKLVLPSDARVILMGDLHGDVRSLMRTLEELNRQAILDGFKLRDPKCYFLFLGDYTDRGVYGVEVLYTLLRLKAANPDQVHLVRGNHEDFNIVSRYGFLDELRGKYGDKATPPNITKVMRLYDRLPVVMYVGNGTDFLQMNHGGMEPGYDPRALLATPCAPGSLRYQLLGELRQRAYHGAHAGWLGDTPAPDVTALVEKHLGDFTPTSPTKPRAIGFMWNDFTVFGDEPALGFNRSLVFGAAPTRRILEDASTDRVRVRGVVRAHQHSSSLNPLMSRLVACNGAFRHWQEGETTADASKTVDELRTSLRPEESRTIPNGSVWTFNVSPDSQYGVGCGCNFVTLGILTMSAKFEEWRMRVVRIDVF